MNKTQRRFYRVPPKRSGHQGRERYEKKVGEEIEEVMPPRTTRRLPFQYDKPMMNRCCFASPDQKDFGQIAEDDRRSTSKTYDQYKNILLEQYGFDPSVPVMKVKKAEEACVDANKKGHKSRCVNTENKITLSAYAETTASVQWLNIDNVDEIDRYLAGEKTAVITDLPTAAPKNVHISEVPRVKVIAEKFTKFKKNDIELRKLDEKVVCIEYDIFEKSSMGDSEKPVQKMRAYFSLKPAVAVDCDGRDGKEKPVLEEIPSDVKEEFNICNDDFKSLKNKEIEIIDGKIDENRAYLEDLKRVLNRKQAIYTKKNKTTLDLQSLFEMAKRDSPPLDCDFSDTNLLSKAELDEVKELILKKCVSSVHGISRRKVKCDDDDINIALNGEKGIISQSFIKELLREIGEV